MPPEQYHHGMQAPMVSNNPQAQHQYRQQLALNKQRQQKMETLKQIHRKNQMLASGQQAPHMQGMVPPPMYPGNMVAGPGMQTYMRNKQQQHMQALQQHHQLQQRRMQIMRMQQQQQMHQQQMMSQQYAYPPSGQPGIHAGMRPMQANPPMQMQQVMQQTRQYPAMMGPAGMRQPGMQYPPQQAPPGMGQVMGPRPGGMY
jgi:hypothetical protein